MKLNTKKTEGATEKPMDWEEELDKGHLWDIVDGTVYTGALKQFIKDLLKDSNAYQAGVGAGEVNNPHTYDIYTQSDMDFKIAEYKQKLIQKLQGMKKRPYSKINLKSTQHGYTENLYFNDCLDEVEAVIKEV